MEDSNPSSIDAPILDPEVVSHLDEASRVMKEVKIWAQEYVKPGMSIYSISNAISEKIRSFQPKQLNGGIAFPVGVALNNAVSNWLVPRADTTAYGGNDVLKLEFAVHNEGYIVDNAFTIMPDPEFESSNADPAVIEAKKSLILVDKLCKTASDLACEQLKVGASVGDVGNSISEIIEACESKFEKQVTFIKNIYGHQIGQWDILGSNVIPVVKQHLVPKQVKQVYDLKHKLQVGETYVVDISCCVNGMPVANTLDASICFIKTPRSSAAERTKGTSSQQSCSRPTIQFSSAKKVYFEITKRYGNLAFTMEGVEDIPRYQIAMKHLQNIGVIQPIAPTYVPMKKALAIRYKRTVLITPEGPKVLS